MKSLGSPSSVAVVGMILGVQGVLECWKGRDKKVKERDSVKSLFLQGGCCPMCMK